MQHEVLVNLLQSQQARFRLIEHPAEGRSELVAQIRQTAPGQGAKAMLCKSKGSDATLALFILPGDRRLDFKKVADVLGVKKATLASEQEVMSATGNVIGAVPPFADHNLSLWVDRSLVAACDEIAFNAGCLDRSIVLNTQDYLRIAQPTLVEVSN